MNGVVLWSDASHHKAVIWCEDQGDLAYYSHKQRQAPVDLHEGDLICFDLSLHQNQRMAENPQILEEAACSGLAQSLAVAQPDGVVSSSRAQGSAQIIPFTPRSMQKQRGGSSRCNYIG
ncbi:MAG: hypothetical protein COB16_19225 [Rhodobacteraceae bacterium]|nr:MAG: hypothetical protein COB16_19225 [Paracoccaceae bacterium]